ncbi:unnamed protein product [Rotaria sordida]|uniref:LamG domain-containing protein n=1 Tax=Rotaria sordida TaxID=392033 RepID=A0A814TIF8_9BILA|nr:unnamed protein product [Rotaria sordida]CAF1162153.1 unnamed protein product [Rotaria sordida]
MAGVARKQKVITRLTTYYSDLTDNTADRIYDKAMNLYHESPQSRIGTLVHVSTTSTGNGSWCFPLIGFASNGSLVAQIYNGATILSVTASVIIPLSSPFWTHIVQTWSSTNGLRLYIDNILVASRSSATVFAASGMTPNYLTLASSLSGSGSCWAGGIDLASSFTGSVDDFRIYS